MTFDDEFTQDSYIDSGKWNGGASNTDWCENGGNYMFTEPESNPCQNDPGNITFSSTNGLEMRTPNDRTRNSNGIYVGSPDAAMTTANKFVQKFGYWEASIKKSACVGDHFDFWMHPQP
jgi:hypothetical protein